MPTRAPRRCTRAGCPNRAPCPRHQAPKPRAKRPTRQQLGYDEDWLRESEAYRAAHQICEGCGRRPSAHTDHIDGDRTNNTWANYQALCVPCHSRKTVRHDGGFGRPRTPRPGHGR